MLEAELVYDSESAWSLHISGDNCWQSFAQESGKHIVQRIPPTESRGRRHTSTVSVAVLPMVQHEKKTLSASDIEFITQRGHGSGGQNVNKVASAVRALHRPTGISVFINGRDQHRNKQLAIEILTARVNARDRLAIDDAHNRAKSQQIAFGTRSGKKRTYNFINSFVLDHQTGKKTHRIEEVMKGRFELLS